jgi:hypothetical protein
MTRSEGVILGIFSFILGGMLGAAITLRITTKQLQALAPKTTTEAPMVSQSNFDILQQIADTWKARAEKCEVRDRNATLIYERRAEELPGIPILHGVFTLQLGSKQNHPEGDLKLVWAIPSQVQVYTNLPGAQFEWVDGKSGATIGRFPATPPPAQ